MPVRYIQGNVQRLPVKLVNDVERPERPAADQPVMHEVHRPMQVRPYWLSERL